MNITFKDSLSPIITGGASARQTAAPTSPRDTVVLGSTPAAPRVIPRPSPRDDASVIDGMIDRVVPNPNGGVATLYLKPFTKLPQPILQPSASGFDSRNIYNLATVRENGTTFMLYRAEDKSEPAGQCTGRIGLATSKDGVHFERESKPVLVPTEPYESRGVEDPRLVKIDGTYYMTYTGYDGDKARLCVATSKNLHNWDKHGPVFSDFQATGNWTKSGAILPEKVKEGLYRGHYVMFCCDTNVYMAISDDLTHWTPIMNPVITPRPGHFDSDLVESGPPPVMTKHGILMIYNSKGDGGYHVGAVLLDPKDPSKILARTDQPLLSPTAEWEKNGYINNVVFAEGMDVQDGKVNLYYGGADHEIGLAINPAAQAPGVGAPVAAALALATKGQ